MEMYSDHNLGKGSIEGFGWVDAGSARSIMKEN